MSKKSLLQERIVYKPFEYPQAHDYWMKQQQAHWLHTEVPMMSDVNDWKQNLTETEKNIIGSILKGFAQTETVVNDYWSTLVTSWFRKPEVIKMAVTFGAFETIHAEAYSLLNEELGLDDSLRTLKGLTPGMLVTLGEQKILKLEDFADLASDELTGGYDVIKGERVKIQGYLEDFALSKDEADNLIMSARNIVYKD